jgi:hypothetical protein
MRIPYYLIALVLFIASKPSYAQTHGKLSGTVITAAGKAPIEYASASISKPNGKKAGAGYPARCFSERSGQNSSTLPSSAP